MRSLIFTVLALAILVVTAGTIGCTKPANDFAAVNSSKEITTGSSDVKEEAVQASDTDDYGRPRLRDRLKKLFPKRKKNK
jgi:hypothetical protein